MVSTAQVFFVAPSMASGNPAGAYDLVTPQGTPKDSTTTLTANSATAGWQLVKWKTAGAAAAGAAALPAVGTAATGFGTRFRQATDIASTATAQRIFPAGQWTISGDITSGTYALLAASPNYNMAAIVYRVSSAGVIGAELFRGQAPAAAIAAGTTTYFSFVTTQPQITLAAGEDLHVEWYWLFQATANVLNQITNNTIVLGMNTANSYVQTPPPGIRTNYLPAAQAAATLATAAVQRTVAVFKAATAAIGAAFAKGLAANRAASTSMVAQDSVNVRPGAKQGTTVVTAVIAKNIVPSAKQGLVVATAAVRKALAVNRATSVAAGAASSRALGLGAKQASVTITAARTQFLNLARRFSASTSAIASTTLGLSQSILNRFSGGQVAQTIKKFFFSVFDD